MRDGTSTYTAVPETDQIQTLHSRDREILRPADESEKEAPREGRVEKKWECALQNFSSGIFSLSQCYCQMQSFSIYSIFLCIYTGILQFIYFMYFVFSMTLYMIQMLRILYLHFYIYPYILFFTHCFSKYILDTNFFHAFLCILNSRINIYVLYLQSTFALFRHFILSIIISSIRLHFYIVYLLHIHLFLHISPIYFYRCNPLKRYTIHISYRMQAK